MKKVVTCAVVCCGILMVVGCARNISSNAYDAKTVGAASATLDGIIVSKRIVTVEEGERLENNATGGLVGAVAGGALGNAVGGGRGRTVATVAGAVLGGAAGAYAEKSLKSQEAIEYIVELDFGEKRSVVQGADVDLRVGQRVYLVIDPRGRSRLIAR